jgi:hypothetical protein
MASAMGTRTETNIKAPAGATAVDTTNVDNASEMTKPSVFRCRPYRGFDAWDRLQTHGSRRGLFAVATTWLEEAAVKFLVVGITNYQISSNGGIQQVLSGKIPAGVLTHAIIFSSSSSLLRSQLRTATVSRRPPAAPGTLQRQQPPGRSFFETVYRWANLSR